MIINSIELENFRSFYGTQKIDFAIDKIKNTTFIWADNNVGKTNLLNAITWCLHEQFTSSFRRTDDLLNHQAKSEGTNSFSVTLNFEESGKLYSVKRMGGSLAGFLLHEIIDGDYRVIDKPLLFINSIIPKDMIKYFIIDGEGISESVDSKGQISATKPLEDIMGFQVAEKTLVDLKTIRGEHTKELSQLDVESDLSRVQKKLDKLEILHDGYQKEKKNFEDALENYRNSYEKADEYLKNANHEVVKLKTQERDRLISDLRSQEARLKKYEHEKISLIRKYSWVAFSNKLSNEGIDFIDENRYKGTIPAPFNQSLIQDIISDAQCICGAEIKPGTKAYNEISEKLGKAANPDILNRIAGARSQLQVIKSFSKGALEDISNNISEIRSIESKIIDIKDRLDEISIEIQDVETGKISHYESEYARCSQQIASTERQIGSKETDIKYCLDEITKLRDETRRLSALSPRAQAMQEKIDFIDEVTKVIENELKSALDNIKIELVSKMNSFIKTHLAQDLTVKATKDLKIGLYNNNSDLIAPGGGVTTMLSLVFTSVLISIAEIRKGARGNILTPGAIAPVVLDAPFSRLSETYAPKLASALPPNAEQLIIFMYEGNAKGGEKAIRKNGHVGREYYLLQQLTASDEGKPASYLTVGDKKYPLNEYNQEKDTVRIREVSPNANFY